MRDLWFSAKHGAADLALQDFMGSEFKKLAGYKVAQTDVYAHPVLVGNRLFIKDQDSVALFVIE